MNHQIAILTDTAFSRFVLELKHAALMFDQTIVLKTSLAQFDDISKKQSPEQLIGADLDYLQEHGVVKIEPDPSDMLFETADSSYTRVREDARSALCVALLSTGRDQDRWIRCAANGTARAVSLLLKKNMEADCVPITFGSQSEVATLGPSPASADDGAVTRAEAFAFAFKRLPIPDNLTPWEDIIEFRNDHNSRAAFLGLRVWIDEAIRDRLSASELRDKLDYEYDQYERALQRHRCKYRHGVLEAIVTATIGLPENLIKIKWSKAIKAFFKFGQLKIELMQAEAEAPGSKLQYLVRANERFGK